MKKIILAIFIVFVLCACVQEDLDTYKYTVRNESGKNIIIRSYYSTSPEVIPVITNLSDSKELTKTETTKHTYNFSNFFGDNSSWIRDSITIIYGGEKIMFFKSDCVNDRNPLNFCKYNGLEETFIFTKEDYENAEFCDDECND
jgi:uncharacterized lipoprotein YehR (DUF1307 family)